jgi:hypothetical protein
MTHFAIRSLFLGGLVLGLVGHMDNPSALFGEKAGAILREAALRCSAARASCQIAGIELGGDGQSVAGALIAGSSKVKASDMLKGLRLPKVLTLLDERVVPETLVNAAHSQLGHWAGDATRKLMSSRSASAARALN